MLKHRVSHSGVVSLQALWDTTANVLSKSCGVGAGSCLTERGSFNSVCNGSNDTEMKCTFLFPLCKRSVCEVTVPWEAHYQVYHGRKNHSFLRSDEKLDSSNKQQQQSSEWSVYMRGVHKQPFGMWGEIVELSLVSIYNHIPSAFACVSVL